MIYRGKKILVLGLARSGYSVAMLLRELGANVTVNDHSPKDKCYAISELENVGIDVICGEHSLSLLDSETSLLVKNPGIPYENPLVQKAIQLGIPVITEIEIASQISTAPIIGITGSNGKTTTTTLIGEMLKAAEKKPVVAGNIGIALSQVAKDVKQDEVIVAELSSFQLKGTKKFHPHIAILLNIYPAHLDYHHNMDDYVKAKMNIFKNQTANDFAIINANCQICLEKVNTINSEKYFFSVKEEVEKGIYLANNSLILKDNNSLTEIITVNEILLKGLHNLENIMAATLAAYLYQVPLDIIQSVLKSFKGVEHRLEYVGNFRGVEYYNDSKATNPEATKIALNSFEQPVILLAGGLDRGITFDELVEPFRNKVKILITYGQAKEKLKIAGIKAGLPQIFSVNNVTEAVELAASLAQEKTVVLLSPACASWDIYSSFEERGRIFKQTVHKLI